MLLFIVLMSSFVVVLALCTWKGMKYVCMGSTCSTLRKAVLLADVLVDTILLGGWFFFHGFGGAWLVPLMQAAAVFFIAQVLFTLFVWLSVFFRSLYRFFAGASIPFDRSRRNLLKGAAVYPVAAAGLAGYGSLVERENAVEREFQIPVKGLPANLKGFRMVQLSDVHLGSFFSVEDLRELLQRVVAGKPDMVCVTGDIFDDRSQNAEAVKVLDSFTDAFPLGIWYCYGNHEHMRGIDEIAEMLSNTKIHVLRNQSEIAVEGERPLVLLGADYPKHRERFQEEKAEYFEETLKDVPQNAIKILLAHHPEFIDNAAKAGVALTLTGHTHGSQIGIFGMPLFPVFKYTRGMVKLGDSYGYVHSGNGSWFPCRIGCPPEIAYFTLRNG